MGGGHITFQEGGFVVMVATTARLLFLLFSLWMSTGAEAFGHGGCCRQRGPARRPAVRMAAVSQDHIVLDWEVVFDEEEIEMQVALQALRRLRPPKPDLRALGETLVRGWQPWDDRESVPTHRFRTFDLRRKFETVLGGVCPQRPSETIMLLRMLFEEHAIMDPDPEAVRKKSSRGTRPLTAGEVVENWELLMERCVMKWVEEEGCTPEAVLERLDSASRETLGEWVAQDPNEFLWAAQHRGDVGDALTAVLGTSSSATVVLRSTNPIAEVKRDLLEYLIEQCIAAQAPSRVNTTLAKASSVQEIADLLHKCRHDHGKRVAYYGSSWQTMSLLTSIKKEELSDLDCKASAEGASSSLELSLVGWAKRHNNWRQRAAAHDSSQVNLVTARELVPGSSQIPDMIGGSEAIIEIEGRREERS